MKVIIDGNGLIAGTGISTYIRSLLTHIARIDKITEYIVFAAFFNDFEHKKTQLKACIPEQDNFSLDCRRIPESLVLFLERKARVRVIEHLIARHKADVFHGTGNLLPRLKRMPSVLTAHHFYVPGDPLFPSSAIRREREYFNATVHSIREATRIIAVSRFTADELGRHFPATRENTTVIYEGIADIFTDSNARPMPDLITKKYGLHTPYIYCSGPLNERKNIARLIEAFALLRTKGRKDAARSLNYVQEMVSVHARHKAF